MPDTSIAIIGAACRFPGAADLAAFWSLLAEERDAVGTVPETRWATRFYGHPSPAEPGKSYSWAAGLIERVDLFDPGFFGISAREAVQMDPQQRLLLELAWEALEDSGVTARALRGSGGGVYVGASATEYANRRYGDPNSGDAYFMTGNTLSIFANRISYVFDLHGPSLTVDTACSSSMVALHLACEDLRRGNVPVALVGGVNLLLSPFPYIGFSRAGMLSRIGKCFSFDARGDGYVRGEGGGMVLLKPLADALRDGDPVRGVIRASGVNSDGRTIGLSLPSKAAQQGLMERLYREEGIDPNALAFVEAHGTGTPAGDPIEAAAIGEALGRPRREPLTIGSVKTNIGHLEAASGMAGLLKAMLALDHRMLPRSLNFETVNPNIDLSQLNLRVAARPMPLPAGDVPLLAGISNFGFGGTNVHVVLAEKPRSEPPPVLDQSALPPLLISARSEAALRDGAAAWQALLADAPAAAVPDLIRGAARARDHHLHRAALLPTGLPTLLGALGTLAEAGHGPGILIDTAVPGGRLAFVFSGNGAQWAGMGRDALASNAVFRAAVEDVDRVLHPLLGWSVLERLETVQEPADLAATDVAQPLLFAVQIGIVTTLRALGVDAEAVVGHSVGEIAAAWAAGILSLEVAARVIALRSRHQHRTAGTGRMAVIGIGAEEALEAISALDLDTEIAGFNAPRSLTLAGSEAGLRTLGAVAKSRGWMFQLLDLDYAFHSEAMDPVRGGLIESLAGLEPSRGDRLFVSTVEGCAIEGEALDAHYWWRNIREPIRFADSIRHLARHGIRLFLEIGPSAVLKSYIREILRGADEAGRVLPTLQRKPAPSDPFPRIALACHAAGYDLSDAAWYDGSRAIRELPRYSWQREPFWIAQSAEAIDISTPLFDHPLLGFRRTVESVEWLSQLDTVLHPWLADHRVDRAVILPAAAIIEIALAAAAVRFPSAAILEASDFEIRRPVALDAERLREMRFRMDPETGLFELAGRARLGEDPWSRHAVGRIAAAEAMPVEAPAPMRSGRTIEAAELYAIARSLGLHYGPEFRRVERVEIGSPEAALVHFVAAAEPDDFLIDPRVLDGAFQGLLALISGDPQVAVETILLPWRFDRVRWATGPRQPIRTAAIRVRRATGRAVSADILLMDATNRPRAWLQGCWFRPMQAGRRLLFEDLVFRSVGEPAPLDQPPASSAGLARVTAAFDGRAEPATGESAETDALTEVFVAAAAFEAIASLVPAGAGLSVEGGIRSGIVAEDARGLLNSLLGVLEGHGLAAEEDGVWYLALTSELPAATEIWQSMLFGNPAAAAANALLIDAARTLPAVLSAGTGRRARIPAALANQLIFGPVTAEPVVAALREAITALLVDWPADRPLRILEVGAGSGIVAARLLRGWAVPPSGLAYLATDPREENVVLLTEALAAFPHAEARLWTPGEGEFDFSPVVGGFDLIVSAAALSFLPQGETVLAAIGDRLAPGGVLLALEPGPNPVWDFVFGQDRSWWKTSPDGDPRHSGLQSGSGWATCLGRAGLTDATHRLIVREPWPISAVTARSGLRMPGGADAALPEAPILIVASRTDEFATRLLSRLTGAGRAAERVGEGRLDAALARHAEGQPPIVMMLPAAAADLAHSLAEIAETARETASRAAQLWLIIRGSAETDPAAAALIGLGRVIANEFPQSAARRIALDPGLRPQAMLDALLEEVSRSDGEPEIAWTERGRFVPRLTRGPTPSAAAAPPGVRLALSEPGFLDSLRWREMLPMAPGPGEVAIEIHAAGLNFRDVMWAMGLLPDEALIDGFAGPTLGMECAGIVTAIGEGVDHVAPGDRVMAFAPACFASHTVTRAHCVAPMAPGTAFAAAATVPVAFLTVIYALGRLARLAAGETVLIHGGAGAVGLAAIQYARHRGATVIATAGSEIKRTVLASIGVEHVLDSRSLGFVDEVMALTGNQGVDVVLNSLGGEAMERSLGLLKPFGRFCELGKRDFYLNTRIGLRAVRHNISYFAIDADELVVRHPGVTGEIFDELRRLFETGALCPLPYVAYPFAEIVDAFRLMRASGHLGKVVLLPGSALGPIERPPHSFEARGDRSYLVTGGLSGFGLATAEWLVRSGARHLALIGRRGSATPGAADAVALLEAQGALTVEVLACDVADVGALESSLCQVRATMPPIGGIVHAAMVVEDGLVATLDRGGFERVLRPKIDGAEALDRLTRHDPVELFLLYSSATTSLGAPGQASYVAANCALEALARRRQKAGLPALAVAWGPIADAGYLAERPEARDALARRLGAVPMAAATALAQLPALLASGMAVANLAEVNWGVGKSFLPILAEPMFGRLVAGAVTQGGGDLAATLAGKSPEAAKEIVLGLLLDEVSAILRVARSKLDPARPLSDIGMDSLMAVELKIALERRLGVEIPALLLNDSVTLASMAARIAQGFGAAPREDATVYMRHETSSEDEADRLSEQLRADSLEAVGGSE